MVAVPPTMMIIATALVVGCGLVTGVGGPEILRRLPEPQLPDDADPETRAEYQTKISYAALAGPGFAVITGGCSAAAMLISVITQPAQSWSCWLILSVIGVLLAAIDASTTWLPTHLTYTGWLAMIAAIAVLMAIGPADGIRALIPICGGAAITGIGYFLLWRITRGRGVAFGDVRLMPMVGAVAGTLGWSGIYWAVLLGSVIGAVIGVTRLLLRRRGPFPYAPALVAGPYAAAVLLALV